MDNYLIVTRSITHAQRVQRVLARAGLYSRILRGHRAILRGGCGYVIQLAERDLPAALLALQRAELEAGPVYCFRDGRYREVIL